MRWQKLSVLWLFLAFLPPVSAEDVPAEAAGACEALTATPESFQVAWISLERDRVRGSKELQVVRVGDLRSWVRQHGADQTRLLQGMGYVSAKAGGKAEKEWKVAIFDVSASQLCRAVEGATPGADLMGVPACSEEMLRQVGRWESECGYTLDRLDESRGLDTFRISWEEAAAQGFCVFPLERFLEGA